MKKKHKKEKHDKVEKVDKKEKKKKKKKDKENGYSKDDLYLYDLNDVHSASVPNVHDIPESVPLKAAHRSKSMDELREEAQEITNIMMDNVVKIRDREGKLDDLVEQAESLHASTEIFQRTSVKIRRKQWWRNRKMTILLGVVAAVFLILIIVIIVLSATGSI